MLHHVTLEIAPDDRGRAAEFWVTLGFEKVEAPPDLADDYTWFEHEGTQIHLSHNHAPVVPSHGHVAVVVPDYAATLERLEDSGFEVAAKRPRWGSPRAEAVSPGGHLVELMAFAPGES